MSRVVSKKSKANLVPASLAAYWQRSQRPLSSLIFLLPLILLYDVGIIYFASSESWSADIYARRLLRDFFDWFGVTGYYLPGIIVGVVLICWHFARRDPWQFEPRLYGTMWVESLILALPLFVLAMVIFREPVQPQIPPQALPEQWVLLLEGGPKITWQAKMVFSIGAGIYEELLFRLIAIALVHLIIVDVMKLPDHIGAIAAISVSAIMFALYHFSESNPFHFLKFLFYTLAGIYLAGVYILRGFGIVAGTHAVYDILVVLLELTQQQRS